MLAGAIAKECGVNLISVKVCCVNFISLLNGIVVVFF